MRKLVACLTVLLAAVPATGAATKIAPTEAEPGEPFTLLDTQDGRLVDGAAALFEAVSGGGAIEVSLRTHKPYKTAQSRLPVTIAGGDYNVWLKQPGGAPIFIGTLRVTGATPQEPTIQPTSGPRGSLFVITDPQGRIQSGDDAVFYAEGADPTLGVPAEDVVVSADGTTMTGNAPLCAMDNVQHFVSVRGTLTDPSRFGDLGFFVSIAALQPCVRPSCSEVGVPFTISDPQARMSNADRVVFAPQGQSPDQGTPVANVTFSADGTTATGTVPLTVMVGSHFVSVHAGDPATNPPLFNPVLFVVQ